MSGMPYIRRYNGRKGNLRMPKSPSFTRITGTSTFIVFKLEKLCMYDSIARFNFNFINYG